MEMLHTTPLHLSALDDSNADAGDDKAAPQHRKDCHNGQRILCYCRLAMHDHGVFGQALIEKRGWYWPAHVPGNQIDDHFSNLSIGDSDTLKQTLNRKYFF